MMKHLRDKGVKTYDLVGVRLNSSNESLQGVFRFKKGFGGDLKEGYLWKIDIAPIPMKIYDFLVRIRQGKNIQKDIIDQETN
jgi:lipid II:glycine glycyltransferase (peptidoglycan interpeptide bridge formation enzyme)